MFGTCRLCLAVGVDLQDSHILPRWSYKRARATQASNPNPVVLKDGVVFQSSKQESEHMLCRTCERRMKLGEDYVHGIAYKEDHTEQFTSLVGEVTATGPDGLRVVLPGQLNYQLLAYFGASVVWRGSVAKCIPECHLGSRYEEDFRLYLMEERPFPEQAGCLLTFYDGLTNEGSYVGSICFQPSSTRREGFHDHRFVLFGLAFYFAVGRRLPAWCRTACFAQSAKHCVVLSPQEQLLLGPGRWLAEGRVVGKLAR